MVYWLVEALKKGDQTDHMFKEKNNIYVCATRCIHVHKKPSDLSDYAGKILSIKL